VTETSYLPEHAPTVDVGSPARVLSSSGAHLVSPLSKRPGKRSHAWPQLSGRTFVKSVYTQEDRQKDRQPMMRQSRSPSIGLGLPASVPPAPRETSESNQPDQRDDQPEPEAPEDHDDDPDDDEDSAGRDSGDSSALLRCRHPTLLPRVLPSWRQDNPRTVRWCEGVRESHSG
jgi:hypothetical protein